MAITRRSVLLGAAAGAVLTAGPAIVRAQGGSIRIGVILPMSGIGAEAGAAWLKGVEVAALQWNEAGGLLGRKIEIEVRDDKFTAAGAVAAARDLAGSGINLLIGGAQSPMALGLAPIMPDLNTVLVAPAPTVMSVTHEGFNRHFFRAASNAYMAYVGIGTMLAQKFPEVKSWVTIAPDSENGQDQERYFSLGVQREAKAQGREVKIMKPTFASLNSADYRVEVNRLMNSGAEGLFIGLTAAPAISFLQQGRSVGLDRKFRIIGEAGTELMIAKAMQKSTPGNLWGLSFWVPGMAPFTDYPLSSQLLEGYEKLAGDPNPPGIVQASNRSALAILNAVKKAGSTDTDAVIAALEGLSFDTAAGPYTIRKEDHQGHGFAYFAKIVGRDAPPHFGIDEVIQLDESKIIEPASPGKKFEV